MATATMHFREAPLTHEIVATAQGLPLLHPDPADRFLAATAAVLNLTLVTADQHLLGLGAIGTLANR
ncbi:MAG: PIN domain-containing protein [Candidatus Acidiferrales bacterium]